MCGPRAHHLRQYLITKTGLAQLRDSIYTSFEHKTTPGHAVQSES